VLDFWHHFVSARQKFKGAYDVGQLVDTRERRRIVGDATVSPMDIVLGRTWPDTVVYAKSNFDSHGFTVHPIFYGMPPDHAGLTAYVPYRALLPKGLDGILVTGLGISAHRDAMPVIRMQPDVQNQGYACGTAGAMAAKSAATVRQIDIRALQKHLVEVGCLPENVLSDKDMFPLPKEQVAEAVAQVAPSVFEAKAKAAEAKAKAAEAKAKAAETKPESTAETKTESPAETKPKPAAEKKPERLSLDSIVKDRKALAIVFAQPEDSVPLLETAYAAAGSEDDRLAYAHILALLGSKAGADTLLGKVKATEAFDKGWNYTGMGQFGRSVSETDAYLIALGRTKDPRALDVILEKVKLLDAKSEFSHHRAVAMALEAIGDPKAAPALAELLSKPGMTGYATGSVDDARTISAIGGGTENAPRNNSLRELVLARALYRCGDAGGLGKKILQQYAQDLRGHYARHAQAVLAEKK